MMEGEVEYDPHGKYEPDISYEGAEEYADPEAYQDVAGGYGDMQTGYEEQGYGEEQSGYYETPYNPHARHPPYSKNQQGVGGGYQEQRSYTRGRGGRFRGNYPRGGARGGSGGFRGGSRGRGRGGSDNNSRGRTTFAGIKRPPPNNSSYGQVEGVIDFVKKRKINDNVYRVLIPVKSIKTIIGPKGDNIRQLKEQAGEGCKASIYTQGANKEPIPQGTTERVMSIEGNLDQLKIVLLDIIPKVQGIKGGKQMELRVIVPEHCCSAVIGPKGANVKAIREETESFIQVFTDPLPASGEHVVSVKNQDLDKLATSAVKIFQFIQELKGANNVLLYEPHLWCPGEHGNTGSYMEDLYQARVQPNYQGGNYQGGHGNYQGGGGQVGGYHHPQATTQKYQQQAYDDATQEYYEESYDEGYGYEDATQHTATQAPHGYEETGYYDPNEGYTAANGSSYEEFTVQTYDEEVPPPPRPMASRSRGPLLSHPTRGTRGTAYPAPRGRGGARGSSVSARGGQSARPPYRGSQSYRGSSDRARGRGFTPRGSSGGSRGGARPPQ